MTNVEKIKELLGGRAQRYKTIISVVANAPEELVPELVCWIKRFDRGSSRINGAIAQEILGWLKAGLNPEKHLYSNRDKDLADVMMLDRFKKLEIASIQVHENGLELFSDDTFFVNSGNIFYAIEEAGYECPDLYSIEEYEFNFERAFLEV